MARYRAGYERDYGLRDYDSRRPRYDVGSRGYDRGYRRLDSFGSGYVRPWVGGYHEGYQGGSEGIAVNTGNTGSPRTAGFGRDYRAGGAQAGYGRDYGQRGGTGWTRAGAQRDAFDRGDQGYAGGGGEYDPGYSRGGQDQGAGGGPPRASGEEYRRDLERNRPRFSPVGGMNPATGGSAAYDRGYGRGYDGGWFNQRSRRF